MYLFFFFFSPSECNLVVPECSSISPTMSRNDLLFRPHFIFYLSLKVRYFPSHHFITYLSLFFFISSFFSIASYSETKKKKEVDLKRIADIERWADHALISCLKVSERRMEEKEEKETGEEE